MMVLVDTSVWIDHFRKGNAKLEQLLVKRKVLLHPMIIGELACGNLSNRKEILRLLGDLPQITKASDEEVIYAIEKNNWMGKGIGFVDAHLLSSVLLSAATTLWTMDKRLSNLAAELSKY